MEKVRIAIIGAGNRGTSFARLLAAHQEVQVVAVADPREIHRNSIANTLHIPESGRFRDWHEIITRSDIAIDAVVIAIQDALHCECAIAFAKRGCQLFLEKPMAPTWQECQAIAEAAQNNHVSLTVCHELRYTNYFSALHNAIASGAIGEVETIQHFEAVVYWHQAHSYVRGNWRNEKQSSSMLLAKSCHDLDILSYLVNRKCRKISSFGSLSHFRAEQVPQCAAARCVDCPAAIEAQCPYSAIKIYRRERAELGNFDWPVNIITDNLTLEGVDRALKEGPYGRCVYHCDNDVVDHQTVNMEFDGGVTAVFTMTAFSRLNGMRETRVCGTRGEIIGNGNTLTIYDFLDNSSRVIEIDSQKSGNINDGHGGGDGAIIDGWCKLLTQGENAKIKTGPAETLESHRMVFAAELARHSGCTVELCDNGDFKKI